MYRSVSVRWLIALLLVISGCGRQAPTRLSSTRAPISISAAVTATPVQATQATAVPPASRTALVPPVATEIPPSPSAATAPPTQTAVPPTGIVVTATPTAPPPLTRALQAPPATELPTVEVSPQPVATPIILPPRWTLIGLIAGPGQPGRLYALQAIYVAGKDIARQRLLISDDGGNTWAPFLGGLPPTTSLLTLSMDYAQPDALYIGSIDGLYRWSGSAWEKVSSIPVFALSVTYGRPERLWAITRTTDAQAFVGVVRSDDRGRTWQDGGLKLSGQSSIGVDPRDPNSAYVLWGYRAWWYELQRWDGRTQWSRLATPPGPNGQPMETMINVRGWTIDGANGAIYLTLGTESSCFPANQLWRSSNPFEPAAQNVRWELIHDFGPQNTARLLASGWSPQGLVLYAEISSLATDCNPIDQAQLYLSPNGGQSWRPLGLPYEFNE